MLQQHQMGEPDAPYGYNCAGGQPMNYTAWSIADREPNDRRSNTNGLSSDCAKILVHGADGYPNGAWAVGPCADSRRCVCEYGTGPSEEYVATINADTQLTPMVTAVWVTLGVVVPLIWLFPPLALLAGMGIYALTTKRAAPASAAESAAVAKLEAAETAARSLRWRINGFLIQLGFIVLTIGLAAPNNCEAILGSGEFYASLPYFGFVLLILAIRPVDVLLIRVACIICTVINVGFALVVPGWILSAVFGDWMTDFLVAVAFVTGFMALNVVFWTFFLLWPAWVCDCCDCPDKRRLPPRRLLRRLWIVLRIIILQESIAIWAVPFARNMANGGVVAGRGDDDNTGMLMHGTLMLLLALALTPANRGRFLRLLNRLLARGGSEKHEEAAAVAALLGSRSAAATLTESAKHFRAMKLNALTRAHLADNKPDPELINLTVPAKLGECHAFVSHSWSDDGEAKYDRLHEWAKGDVDVEAEAWAKGDVLLWLDKACIDQLRIEQSLACLPCFLAGCRQLLCLAGPSYPARLWCVMEIFVFMKMGGERGSLRVKLLDETAGLAARLASFDAGKAQTFLDRDRQRLWATIEATFGTFDNFNRLVRVLIASGLETDAVTSSGAALMA